MNEKNFGTQIEPFTIRGHSEFYHGWLAWILLRPDDESRNEHWRHGWKMASETGPDAVEVLRDEIKLGHIVVSESLTPSEKHSE